jgi:hypothetical protein
MCWPKLHLKRMSKMTSGHFVFVIVKTTTSVFAYFKSFEKTTVCGHQEQKFCQVVSPSTSSPWLEVLNSTLPCKINPSLAGSSSWRILVLVLTFTTYTRLAQWDIFTFLSHSPSQKKPIYKNSIFQEANFYFFWVWEKNETMGFLKHTVMHETRRSRSTDVTHINTVSKTVQS